MTLKDIPKRKWFGLLFVLVLGVGCAAQAKRSLVHSEEVTRLFFEDRVLPEFNYYYQGSEKLPRVVIAIDKGYHLRSDLWQSIEITEEKLADWRKKAQIGNSRTGANGAELLAPDNSRVAIWFSYNPKIKWCRAEIYEGKAIRLFFSDHHDLTRTALPAIGI